MMAYISRPIYDPCRADAVENALKVVKRAYELIHKAEYLNDKQIEDSKESTTLLESYGEKLAFAAFAKQYVLLEGRTMNKVVTELIDNSINGLRHTQKLLTGVYEKYSSVYPNDDLSLDRYFRAITNYLLNAVEKVVHDTKVADGKDELIKIIDDAMDSLRLATESARNFTVEAHKINFDQDSDYDALSGLCAYVNIISRDLQEIYLYLDQAIDKLKYDKIL